MQIFGNIVDTWMKFIRLGGFICNFRLVLEFFNFVLKEKRIEVYNEDFI